MKIFNPEIFQGSLKKKNYFEGWYFKNVSSDKKNIVAIIPGISLTQKPHAFIQYFNGSTRVYKYFKYSLSEFKASGRDFRITISKSSFSKDECRLDIDQSNDRIKGSLKYSDQRLFPKTIASPGIMGYFSFIPFMQTKHGVVSMDHNIQGSLLVNSQDIDFKNGRGYIEKDWGTSFPDDYLWLQCNNFEEKGISVLFSVAKIPWIGKYFIGFLGFILLPSGEVIRFATYNRAKIIHLKKEKEVLIIKIKIKNYLISFKVKIQDFTGLKSPKIGEMVGIIKESLNSEIDLSVIKDDKTLLESHGEIVGLEIHNKILDYFK